MLQQLREVDLWLVDSLEVPASLHDVDGRFVHLNAAAERACGNSNEQLLGQHFTKLVPPDALQIVETQFRRAVERGEPTDFETAFVDAGGNRRHTRAQHLPLRQGDAIVGVLILAFEVRQRPPELPSRTRQPRLTPRQHTILEMVASGRSTSEIASELTLSTETVRNHLRAVMRELQAHTRLEALTIAQRLGLLAAPALGPQPSQAGVGGP